MLARYLHHLFCDSLHGAELGLTAKSYLDPYFLAPRVTRADTRRTVARKESATREDLINQGPKL